MKLGQIFESATVTAEQQIGDRFADVCAEFVGTRATTSWLSLAKPPHGRIKLIVGRKDVRGNTRTLAVDYRDGDVRRLSDIVDFLDRAN